MEAIITNRWTYAEVGRINHDAWAGMRVGVVPYSTFDGATTVTGTKCGTIAISKETFNSISRETWDALHDGKLKIIDLDIDVEAWV